MKKIKTITSPEKPLKKSILSQKIPYSKPKSLLNLTEQSLSYQKIKKTNAIKWDFSTSQRMIGQKRVSKILGQTIELNKGIQRVFLYLEFEFTDEDFLYLVQGLKRLKPLKEITLNFSDCCCITDTGLSSLMKGLKRLCWIKEISLYLGNFYLITDAGFHSISQSLKKMASLKNVYLSIWPFSPDYDVTDRGMRKFYGSINRLAKLEKLTLRIIEYEEMTDMSLASLKFQKNISLKELDLSLEEGVRLTDQGLYFLAQSLKGLVNLQSLKLKITGCSGFTDLGLNEICKMINSLPYLQEMDLVFAEESRFGNVSCCDILRFCRCLWEENYFHFESWQGVSDPGLIALCQFLERLVSLESLQIDFEDFFGITDDGIISLCKVLERMSLLRSLHISLITCEEISDFAVKELIDRMENLADLKNIGFGLFYCKEITDGSLRAISQFLTSKESLEWLYLNVAGNEGVTDEGMDDLRKDMENLQKQKTNSRIDFVIE